MYDWKIPDEWNIKDAYIKEKSGKKILDFKKNLLSVVYHSVPIRRWINKNQLLKKIHVDNDLKMQHLTLHLIIKKIGDFVCLRKILKVK